VLGPARDGGYYLLGVKAPHATLFADIAWSTETVAETSAIPSPRPVRSIPGRMSPG